MKITTVIRGNDHIINLHPQALLFNALGASLPEFAHLPMIMDSSGTKMSKRNITNTSVLVKDYIKMGYDPLAILNYLVRFGWSDKDNETFSLDELVNKFDLSNVKKSNGVFDIKKFESINFKIIKDSKYVTDQQYVDRLKYYTAHDAGVLLPVLRNQARTYLEAAYILQKIHNPSIKVDIDRKYFEEIKQIVRNNFTLEGLNSSIRDFAKSKDLALKHILPNINLALIGDVNSPPFNYVMQYIGLEKTIERLS
jgi:glutamyl-tRNA synthetase